MSLCVGLAVQLIASNVAEAKIKEKDYDGPYLWDGVIYDKFVRKQMSNGYIDEYTNKEIFCTSWVFNPGFSLLDDGALAVFYLILLFWLRFA